MNGVVTLENGVSIVQAIAPRAGRPRVYAALHLGSPVLGYLGLRLQAEPEMWLIARELDGRNPMPRSKRDYARRKVAWVEATAGVPFLDTDSRAILRARERLLAGKPLYAAVDVPGDVVARADRATLCGESILLASGIFRLAAMAGADVQVVVSVHRAGRIVVRCLPPINDVDPTRLGAAVTAKMETVIRDCPEEWWLWPFVLA